MRIAKKMRSALFPNAPPDLRARRTSQKNVTRAAAPKAIETNRVAQADTTSTSTTADASPDRDKTVGERAQHRFYQRQKETNYRDKEKQRHEVPHHHRHARTKGHSRSQTREHCKRERTPEKMFGAFRDTLFLWQARQPALELDSQE
jgi:hypothetical protein